MTSSTEASAASATPLQITSVNVNGIRAAVKQRSETNLGMLDWLRRSNSDVVLLQEVRASEEQTQEALAEALDEGWHYVGAPAKAKGRAGVGILSREPLADVHIGIEGFEDAGRYIEGTFRGVRVGSLYLPSGSAKTEKQDEKYRFLDVFAEYLGGVDPASKMVIGGDWNICHRREDLKNWKTNRTKSGFLPDERAFMDSVFGTFPDATTQVEGAGQWAGAVEYTGTPREVAGEPRWFDVARRLQPEDAPYTWWTYRGKAFDTDAGWRIDYQAVTKPMLDAAQRSWVDKAQAYDLRWSDHSPLNVVYHLED